MDKYSSEIEKTIKKWFEEVFDKLVDLDDEPFIDSYVRSHSNNIFDKKRTQASRHGIITNHD
jgi:hypothetical protein